MQWDGNRRSPAALIVRRLSRSRAEHGELIRRVGWTRIGGSRLVKSESVAVAEAWRDGPGKATEAARRVGRTRPVAPQIPYGPNGKIKRRCDFALALIALFLLLPVFLVIAIAVTLESPGPAFFTQWRGGQ